MSEKRDLATKQGDGFPKFDVQSKQFLQTMDNLNVNSSTKELLQSNDHANNMDQHD